MAPVRKPKLGLVGLGQMGMPACARLSEAGFAVHATDLRPDLREAAVGSGGRWEPTVAGAAAAADVLITMLPGTAEVRAVIGEAVSTLGPGTTWIEMSSAAPGTAAEIMAVAAPRQIRVLDAPVAGGPPDARAGRLLTFVGGAPPDVAAVRPILDTLADRVLEVGRPGNGYLVKLLINLLWFGQAVANAEALTLARRAGLDLDVLRHAIGQSAAASHFMTVDADALLAGDDLETFALARCCEQLSAVLTLGDGLGVALDLAAVVAEVHQRALSRYGDVNGELLGARLIAEQAGVELQR
jgi:3-hydroxyisobutyrate dehydrogenase